MKKKLLWVAIITPLILLLDQWTKYLVDHKFYLHETLNIIPGFFNLTYVRNTGAAFGFLAQADESWRRYFFLLVPVIALVVLIYFLRRLPEKALMQTIAVSLVMAGAVGNLIDRSRFGYVIDFFDFHWQEVYHFAVFNIADMAICVGAGLLMLFTAPKTSPQEESPHVSRPL